MANFPAPAYFSDALRTQAEVKTALEDFLAATRQLPGGSGAPSTLVIASGSVTPTGDTHIVDTEAAAATDDLANIAQTNIPDGRLLMLRSASATKVVVVKHGAGGAGQVSLADAADLALVGPSMWLVLRRAGALWEEVGVFHGNEKAAFRTRLGVPSLAASPNLFTKRQEWAKGATLTAAATLLLGSDGNFFHVTGNTTISALSATSPAAQAGAAITLLFEGTPTLIHSAALILQGGANAVMTPGRSAGFVYEGSSVWRELGGVGAGPSVIDAVATDGLVENTAVEGTLYTGTIPGGALGTRGRARFEPILSSVETGGLQFPVVQRTLTLRLKLNGTTVWSRAIRVRFETEEGTVGIGAASRLEVLVCADGTHAAQLVVVSFLGFDAESGLPVRFDEDTHIATTVNAAADMTLALTAQFSNTGAPGFSIRMKHALLEGLQAG